jgi:hypothetical protein
MNTTTTTQTGRLTRVLRLFLVAAVIAVWPASTAGAGAASFVRPAQASLIEDYFRDHPPSCVGPNCGTGNIDLGHVVLALGVVAGLGWIVSRLR